MEEEEEQFNVEDDHVKRVSSVNLDSLQAYDEYFDDGEDMSEVSCVIKESYKRVIRNIFDETCKSFLMHIKNLHKHADINNH